MNQRLLDAMLAWLEACGSIEGRGRQVRRLDDGRVIGLELRQIRVAGRHGWLSAYMPRFHFATAADAIAWFGA